VTVRREEGVQCPQHPVIERHALSSERESARPSPYGVLAEIEALGLNLIEVR
jgi:hypothetical protein